MQALLDIKDKELQDLQAQQGPQAQLGPQTQQKLTIPIKERIDEDPNDKNKDYQEQSNERTNIVNSFTLEEEEIYNMITKQILSDFSKSYFGVPLDSQTMADEDTDYLLEILLSQTAIKSEFDNGRPIFGKEKYERRLEALKKYIISINKGWNPYMYQPKSALSSPYTPSKTSKPDLKEIVLKDPDNPTPKEQEIMDEHDEAYEWVTRYMGNKKFKSIYDRWTPQNLNNFANDYLGARIDPAFIKEYSNNKPREKYIVSLVLEQPAMPWEKDPKTSKLLTSSDKYTFRVRELNKFIKLTQPVSSVAAAKGRKRITTKELKQILKSKTTKSSSAIKNIEKEILDILNS